MGLYVLIIYMLCLLLLLVADWSSGGVDQLSIGPLLVCVTLPHVVLWTLYTTTALSILVHKCNGSSIHV